MCCPVAHVFNVVSNSTHVAIVPTGRPCEKGCTHTVEPDEQAVASGC